MYRDEIVPFTTGDGMPANLVHVVGATPPARGPVLLVHGAGVRANIFRAPVASTLVDVLVADGFDVWLENWRASIDLRPSQWTLDRAAVHDHPKAVEVVLERTASDSIQAVVHCQGSTSFMMAAVAGLVPKVRTIVSNAVSLHPVVPPLARWKIEYFHKPIKAVTRYLDPHWGVESPHVIASAMVGYVRATHHECRNDVCRLASFTYGVGKPTLWSHALLDDTTHEWLQGEFGPVPLTFFDQMSRCIRAGQLVAVDGYDQLPATFASAAPRTAARIVLLAGERNHCFTPESQERTYDFLRRHGAADCALHVFPEYGHLDVFMGKDAARDVFPTIIDALERN
jgi:alpha-beta hydrolase superfamily lysophospholipase